MSFKKALEEIIAEGLGKSLGSPRKMSAKTKQSIDQAYENMKAQRKEQARLEQEGNRLASEENAKKAEMSNQIDKANQDTTPLKLDIRIPDQQRVKNISSVLGKEPEAMNSFIFLLGLDVLDHYKDTAKALETFRASLNKSTTSTFDADKAKDESSKKKTSG